MPDEVVAELEACPMVGEARLDHVNMVRPRPDRVAFDEPGVERWYIVTKRRPPEVLVLLRDQNRHDASLGLLEIRYLDEHVDYRLRRESWNRRAADVLDPADQAF